MRPLLAVALHRKVADEFFENAEVAVDMCCPDGWLLVGGLFAGTGFAVDTATGALYEQEPGEVFLALEPVSAPETSARK